MVIVRTDGNPVHGGAARRAAQDELAHHEYHRDDPGLITRFLHWLGHKFADLFTGGGGSHALLLVLVAIVAVIIVFAVRAGVPSRSGRQVSDAELDPLAAVPARDHRRIAAQLAAEGRHAEALREWLRAAVATIEERGVLPPRPGRTGAATAREAGPLLPAAADELRIATTAFDEVWFGGRDATDADVAHAKAAADAAQSARLTHGAAAVPALAVPQ
jgi:hypothetical protein